MTGGNLHQYEILEKIGEGGMGAVYRARDTRLDRIVAVKILAAEATGDETRRTRFVQEARAAAALNHPNVVSIYDVNNVDGTWFIAMEYVEGRTLGALLRRGGIPIADALAYAIQVAEALVKAHEAGIVHRDLKPANIMVNTEGRVKVLDFGLAKLVEPRHRTLDETETAANGLPVTKQGMVLGTIGYMSPEQVEGKPVDARSDVFSFGAVLYEMVTGRRAFSGDSNISVLSAILRDEPKPVTRTCSASPARDGKNRLPLPAEGPGETFPNCRRSPPCARRGPAGTGFNARI